MSNKVKNEIVSVESAMIKTIEYNYISKKMVVEFVNGSKYVYKDMAEAVYTKFKHSESLGKHFAENIKNHYDYIQI
jgi:hypothetical protein